MLAGVVLNGVAVQKVEDFSNVCNEVGQRIERSRATRLVYIVQQWLGCCTQHNRRTAVCCQQIDSIIEQVNQPDWQSLNLVKDHHRAGKRMQPAHALGPCAEERLQYLDHGGEDDWRIPVFCQHPSAPAIDVRLLTAFPG